MRQRIFSLPSGDKQAEIPIFYARKILGSPTADRGIHSKGTWSDLYTDSASPAFAEGWAPRTQ